MSFFSPAADVNSMLHPAFNDGTNNATSPYGITYGSPAFFINTWTPGGSSTVPNNFVTLGAFSTAPDGTNTAQKLVEAATNQTHSMISGLLYNADIIQNMLKLRLGVIVASAGRTRIALSLSDTAFNQLTAPVPKFPGTSGTQAVFDLSAGTVAVQNTAFNNTFSWIALPATISLVATIGGNKFYLCTIDAVTGYWPGIDTGNNSGGIGHGNIVLATLYIDAGSGNAAANTSYLGDGSSGILAWKASCSHPTMWTLTQTMFEDFINTAGIDINNTRQPGFNFYTYLLGQFDGTSPGPLRNTIDFDVSGSIINMHTQDDLQTGSQNFMASIASDGSPRGYVGRTFSYPWLFEARLAIDAWPGAGSAPGFGRIPDFWTSAAEGFFNTPAAGWPVIPTIESDFCEFVPATGIPNNGYGVFEPVGATSATMFSAVPYPANTSPTLTQYHTYSSYSTSQAPGFPPSGASANMLPNSSFAGTVVGTPGTLPTNSSLVNTSGLTVDVVGFVNNKIQLRIHGTASAPGPITFYFNSAPNFTTANNTIAPGQVWTASVFVRRAGGTDAALTSVTLGIAEINAGNSILLQTTNGQNTEAGRTPINLTRVSVSRRVHANTATKVGMFINFGITQGQATDITYELFQPQLELSAFATAFQSSLSSNDTANPVAGVAAVDTEPFFFRNLIFFDGGHCQDRLLSSLSPLQFCNFTDHNNPFRIALVSQGLHFPVIMTCSQHTWPSHFDFVRVFSTDIALSTLVNQDSVSFPRLTQALDVSGAGAGPWQAGRPTIDGIAGVLTAKVNQIGFSFDESAVVQPIIDKTSINTTQLSMASATTTVVLLPPNPNRLGGSILNDGSANMFVLLGFGIFSGQASSTIFTDKVPPGGRYELPANFVGLVTAAWDNPSGFARITEYS